ncbi:MAG: 3'-5' exonuclease [Clostridia bacterium]|nr:3'-5' exonuclease [Clostridia bacterium]
MSDCASRPFKGKNLFSFPSDYTVIDIETTGLSASAAEIIEVSALRYRGDTLVAEYESFLKPRFPIPPFITALTGITNAMVRDARPRKEVLAELYDFIAADVVIGHNVNFDVNFLYDEFERYLGASFSNDFVDVMRLSRRYLPALPNHKQITVAEHFDVDTSGAHRASKDTEICALNYLGIKKLALKK